MERARHIIGGDVEIWHAPAPQREPVVSNYRIKTEAEYKTLVKDQDYLILCHPNGKHLNETEVVSLLDDLTIYRRDYVPHPIKRPSQCEDFRPDVGPLPDISALAFKTTYCDHYRDRGSSKRERFLNVASQNKSILPTGITEYQAHYQTPDLKPDPELNFATPNCQKPWTQYQSTYKAHYIPHKPSAAAGSILAPNPQEAGPIAPWRQTEYAEEFVSKSPVPWTGTECGDAIPTARFFDLQSTYTSDFPRPNWKVPYIHCDPELGVEGGLKAT